VCKANISLHEVLHRHTFELLDSLVAYGFHMSTSQPAPSKFPRLSFAKARKQILQIDAVQLENSLQLFEKGYVHLSLDAGTIHVNSIVDFVLLRTENLSKKSDFLLYRSVESIEANADFYRTRTCNVLRDLRARNIVVRSIVGDGLAAQLSALCHERPQSIQNNLDFLLCYPYVRNVYFIYCSCHLLNLAFKDILAASPFPSTCRDYVQHVGNSLRTKERRRVLRARCPTFSETRWCHIYLMIEFLAKHWQPIIHLGFALPIELLGFAALIEPIFRLFGQFESRSTLFYMREEKLVCFYARIEQLKRKFEHIDSIVEAADLIVAAVRVRFAEQNDDLAQVADFLGTRGDHASVVKEAMESVSGIEAFYEALLAEEEVNEMITADMGVDRLEEEDEEDDPEEEEFGDCSAERIVDVPGESRGAIETDLTRLSGLKDAQARSGLVQIGVDLIGDYGERSEWAPENIRECQEQFATWFAVHNSELAGRRLPYTSRPLIWVTLGATPQWGRIAEYAQLLLSLPIAETENERFFSLRRFVTGQRGGRMGNDLVTARVRIRTNH
jgi:hypothetical protein